MEIFQTPSIFTRYLENLKRLVILGNFYLSKAQSSEASLKRKRTDGGPRSSTSSGVDMIATTRSCSSEERDRVANKIWLSSAEHARGVFSPMAF
jgi:hypothetical protein